MTSAPATARPQQPNSPANGNNQQRNLPAPIVIGNTLTELKPHFRSLLPAHITPEQFNRVVVTAVNLNPDLGNADRNSLFNACSKCASDGLLPDGREAALVTFGNKVQYLPMVAGVIKRLRQSGEVVAVAARIVYEGELAGGLFRYVIEDGVEKLTHMPMVLGDRGKPALVYATAKLKDGTIQNEVMTVADVEKVRKASRSANNGPWVGWWEEMARKTAIRRLSKYLPFSTEDRRIFETNHEDTEFEEMKTTALAAQPQSLATAAAALAAPAPAPVDGDGVILEGDTNGGANQADPEIAVPITDLHPREGGGHDYARFHKDALAQIATLDPVDVLPWLDAHAEKIAGCRQAKKAWADEIGAAAKERMSAA